MLPYIYVEDAFLTSLAHLENKLSVYSHLDNEFKNIYSLADKTKTIINSCKVLNTDIEINNFRDLIAPLISNRKFSNIREQIYFNKFKEGKLDFFKEIKQDTAIVFSEKSIESFSEKSFFPLTFSSENETFALNIPKDITPPFKVNANMHEINCIKHTSNVLLISDPYIFNDSPNRPLKIEGIINFVKNFVGNDFHLVLFFTKYDKKIELNFDDYISTFKSKIQVETGKTIQISIQLFEHFTSDRSFYSNYCLGNYQHLFDRVSDITLIYIFNKETSNENIEKYSSLKKSIHSLKYKYEQFIKQVEHDPDFYPNITLAFGDPIIPDFWSNFYE